MTVDVRGLTVHYFGYEAWVLDAVSFRQLSGKVTAVVGPSGCGKTTLIRTMCGLVPHCLPSEYAGNVLLDGVEIADARIDHIATRVAYVGQNPDAAVITRAVFDDVAFALKNLRMPAEEITQRTAEALEYVGLTEAAWEDPWTLSGGQRQRLAIAAALAMKPQVLVLDEPTSTVDSLGRERFYAVLKRLRAELRMGIIIVDHDLDPILPMCDQILALDASGSVIACGDAEEVFAQHTQQLRTAGIWLPRSLTGRPAAGLGLGELCGSATRYWQRNGEQWEHVDRIDTAGKGPANLELDSFSVPGRSPEVSMRLGGGELVAVVGVNGAGKSSMLSALAGLSRGHAGNAAALGQPITYGKHRVGYVFQNPEHQMIATSVEKELALTGASAEEVEGLLRRFHLDKHRGQHPMTLSGGQARRLSVATMVAEERSVILLDEPTFGQDWDNTCELLEFIKHLLCEGRTVVIATHDLALATEHCTHLVALPEPGGLANERTEPPAPAGLPPKPEPTPGAFSALNPLTLFFAVLPAMAMIFALKSPALNLALLALASGGMIAARAGRKRTLLALLFPWALAGLLYLVFTYSYAVENGPSIYDRGSTLAASTGFGAVFGLALLSGLPTTPESVLCTLTQTFHLPYRVASAGTASVAFIMRFRQDFQTLRMARALRGIGTRWGILAPAARWTGSVVALMILAVQHGERVALSMDSRGFGAYADRTELDHTLWRWRDWLVVLLVWALTILCWHAM